jgi:hypothetical protein
VRDRRGIVSKLTCQNLIHGRCRRTMRISAVVLTSVLAVGARPVVAQFANTDNLYRAAYCSGVILAESNTMAGQANVSDFRRRWLRYQNFIDLVGPKSETEEHSVLLKVEQQGMLDLASANAKTQGQGLAPKHCFDRCSPKNDKTINDVANLDACMVECTTATDQVRGNILHCLTAPDGLPF